MLLPMDAVIVHVPAFKAVMVPLEVVFVIIVPLTFAIEELEEDHETVLPVVDDGLMVAAIDIFCPTVKLT